MTNTHITIAERRLFSYDMKLNCASNVALVAIEGKKSRDSSYQADGSPEAFKNVSSMEPILATKINFDFITSNRDLVKCRTKIISLKQPLGVIDRILLAAA